MLLNNKSLFSLVQEVHATIGTDFGGGSPLSKCYLMACLAQTLQLKNFVEIGVYRGKSLFPVTVPFHMNGGKAYGIDPYHLDDALEEQAPAPIREQVDGFLRQLPFEALYQDILAKREELGFQDTLEIIRKTSNDAIQDFKDRQITIDMLHIDGNHDTEFVEQDYTNYYPLLSDNAIIVFDDIDWESVNIVYQKARTENLVLCEKENYGVLLKKSKGQNKVLCDNKSLFSLVQEVYATNDADLDGGSSLSKCYMMACLAQSLQLKNYAEIGVHKGKRLFPVAIPFHMNGGKVYGIDPYCLDDELKEQGQVTGTYMEQVDDTIHQLPFEALYQVVLAQREALGFQDTIEIIRKPFNEAAQDFRDRHITIDMLHIDRNCDTKLVEQDYVNYYPLLSDNAIIVFDGINCDSVNAVYQKVRIENHVLLEEEDYAVLMKRAASQADLTLARKLSVALRIAKRKLEIFNSAPVVAVQIHCSNHEDSIERCLNSVLQQIGFFSLRIKIVDEGSIDQTVPIIHRFIRNLDPFDSFSVEFITDCHNDSEVQPLQHLTGILGNSDYFTFCMGADYWNDSQRIQMHINYLRAHPEFAFSLNACTLWDQHTGKFDIYPVPEEMSNNSYSTHDLIKNNFIGNLSLGFFRSDGLSKLNQKVLTARYKPGWSLSLALSTQGRIGFIPKPMTVCQIWDGGKVDDITMKEQAETLLRAIDETNRFLNYEYDEDFGMREEAFYRLFPDIGPSYLSKEYDLIIFDHIYPHPLSAFRYQEFTSLLEEVDSSLILSTGLSVPNLGKTTHDELIRDFSYAQPHIVKKFHKIKSFAELDRVKAKLSYCVFLDTICLALDHLEKAHIPFILELYPGGGFKLNDADCDLRLKRVLRSPYFCGVIVTQQVTYDYLREKNLCPEEKIHFIFGVVTPLSKLENKKDKHHYMDGKATFDICFVAHKYTKYGQDKGYDKFVDTARLLAARRPNARFHVVGPYDDKVLNVSDFSDKIIFYGTRPVEWLDDFYRGMDIILSPNVPFVLAPGFFDGFPTACCTDAALSKVAMFCTDELHQNNGRFVDGDEIVIIKPNAIAIAATIEYYMDNSDQLKALSEAGCVKARQLYSYDAQIAPRISIIENAINTPFVIPRQTIPIMHCFDNGYVIPAAASFDSMLRYANPAYDYKLYVLHTDITIQNQKKLLALVTQYPNASLEFIDMAHRFEDIWSTITIHGHLAKEVLYKLVATSIFPQYDKLIITDVDVVFLGDISPSYFVFDPSDDVYMAGVRHVAPRNTFLEDFYKSYTQFFDENAVNELKICGGYLVMNLRKLREDQMEGVFLDYLRNNVQRLLQAEQDVLNFCSPKEKIRLLPLSYVLCSYSYDIFQTEEQFAADPHYTPQEIKDALIAPIQLHYATRNKPWINPKVTKAEVWFDALRKTDFYDDYEKMIRGQQSPCLKPIPLTDVWPDSKEHVSPVMVSVLCCTYNHSRFIRATLEGLVAQRVNISYEIIVSDDASTDDTQKIICEYRDKYPHLFKKCVLRKENVGIGQNYYEALRLVQGRYLAICDGDDHWIDPNKLARQVEFLETHPDYNICCSSFITHNVGKDSSQDKVFRVNEYIQTCWQIKERYEFDDLLHCRFIASCTVMMRWVLHDRVPEFLSTHNIIDFPLALLHAAFGSIHVMDDQIFAQYNGNAESLTKQSSQGKLLDELKLILFEVNQELAFRFTKNIQEFLSGKSPNAEFSEGAAPGAYINPPRIALTIAEQYGYPKGLRKFYLYYVPPILQRCYRGLRYVVKPGIRFLYLGMAPMRVQLWYHNVLKPKLKGSPPSDPMDLDVLYGFPRGLRRFYVFWMPPFIRFGVRIIRHAIKPVYHELVPQSIQWKIKKKRHKL